MISLKPETLKGQTILVVGLCLFLFHIASLVLYIISSASTVTLEREEQIADRIITVARLIDHAPAEERAYLASEVSGSKFRVSIDKAASVSTIEDDVAVITHLIRPELKSLHDSIAANYVRGELENETDSHFPARAVGIQHVTGPFRIHETLLVSIDLPDGNWLNFRVSGSAWDHIFSINAIPSLTLMAVATVLLAAWAVSRSLALLSRFAEAAEAMSINIQAAQPISEEGPKEIREAVKAFNHMQLHVQQLLDARTQMLGALSHDFRTLLTRLRLRIESIADEAQRDKAVRNLDEMDSMITQTLRYARDESVEESRELIELGPVICDVAEDLKTDEKNVTMTLVHTIHLMCQPIGIQRVLYNIIQNGLFYGQHVHITLRQQHDSAIVEIDDDGPGIDVQQRSRVFTPFYRVESSRNRQTGGTGLGLSIAQAIVRAHGGTIELLDSPQGGLRVRINLPLNHSNTT